MPKTATKPETKPEAKKTTKPKSNVAEFPKDAGKQEKTLSPEIMQEIARRGALNPPAGVSDNAARAFDIIKKKLENASFDEICDETDFSYDAANNALKELEEAGAIERLPELEFRLKPISAAENGQGGKDAETGEKSPEGGEAGESFDILAEAGGVDGSKLKAIAGKQAEEEAEKRTIKLPRNQRLSGMEEDGAIAELEDKALSHEDCAHTKKIMNQKQETLRAEMLEIMKKNNLTTYKHGGFVIKRESKGETVKIVSVSNKDDE